MAFISNGTTILDNGAFSVGLGSKILLSTATASASASIEFTLDTSYDISYFEFINIHPGSASTRFQFNGSTDSGANYNVTKTTTIFIAGHNEADTDATLTYQSGDDLAQSTGFQDLAAYGNSENANDASLSGTLQIFNPSSTTFVKHFIARTNYMAAGGPYTVDSYTAGYFNTTSSVTNLKFQFTSGNIDAGTIKMYGIKGS